MIFCLWFLSLSTMISRVIHIVTCSSNSFLFMDDNILLYRYTTFCLSVLSVDRFLGCFYLLAIKTYCCYEHSCTNFVYTYVFLSLGYTLRSGIAGSYVNSKFNPLRNCQSVFQSECTILHSHQ